MCRLRLKISISAELAEELLIRTRYENTVRITPLQTVHLSMICGSQSDAGRLLGTLAARLTMPLGKKRCQSRWQLATHQKDVVETVERGHRERTGKLHACDYAEKRAKSNDRRRN